MATRSKGHAFEPHRKCVVARMRQSLRDDFPLLGCPKSAVNSSKHKNELKQNFELVNSEAGLDNCPMLGITVAALQI